MKVSNLDRAKILQAWSKALQADKVSEWAHKELTTKLKQYMESGEPKFVLERNGYKFILLGLANIHNDAVMVMTYDLAEGCTEVLNIFTEVDAASEVEVTDVSTEDFEGDFYNSMSVPYTGFLFADDKDGKLHAFKINGSGE